MSDPFGLLLLSLNYSFIYKKLFIVFVHPPFSSKVQGQQFIFISVVILYRPCPRPMSTPSLTKTRIGIPFRPL